VIEHEVNEKSWEWIEPSLKWAEPGWSKERFLREGREHQTKVLEFPGKAWVVVRKEDYILNVQFFYGIKGQNLRLLFYYLDQELREYAKRNNMQVLCCHARPGIARFAVEKGWVGFPIRRQMFLMRYT
jgi:hypothetical protein